MVIHEYYISDQLNNVLIMFFIARQFRSTILPTMNDRELQDIIQHTLRRWLRSKRSPDDSRIGAKRIVKQIRLCGVRFVGRDAEKAPKTH